MLSLPSINTTSPPVLASRPALVSDAVRSASSTGSASAIEPTSAISKQRSRVDNRQDQPSVESGQLVQAGQTARMQSSAIQVNGAEPRSTKDAPPSEKSPVQRALDVQIRELLANVWNASGKAVDFLLGRDDTLLEQTLKEVQLPVEVDLLTGMKAANPGGNPTPGKPPSAGSVQSYNASGNANGTLSRGLLLDLVA
ncbi:hypothetical protein [Hydrogenophaga soli]|nr:hypothetical protein [Burkholderiaceae bacterium]